jgi:hypothetical protein
LYLAGLGWSKLKQADMFTNTAFKLKDCQLNIKFSIPNTNFMFPCAAKKEKPLIRGKVQRFADFAIYHRHENLFQVIVAKNISDNLEYNYFSDQVSTVSFVVTNIFEFILYYFKKVFNLCCRTLNMKPHLQLLLKKFIVIHGFINIFH